MTSDAILLHVAWHTAVDWYNVFWDICAQYFVDHPAVIGGQGVEVEIDESKFGKRNLIEGGLLMVIGYLEELRGRLVIAFWWKWNIEMLLHFYPLYSNMLDLAALCTVTSGVHTAASTAVTGLVIHSTLWTQHLVLIPKVLKGCELL